MHKTTFEYTSLPLACNNTVYYYIPKTPFPALSVLLGRSLPLENTLNPYLRVCLQVCILHGARIGELLKATTKDIIGPDLLLIHGEKKSRDYTMYLPGLVQCFERPIESGQVVRIFPFDYLQVWRKARGIGMVNYLPGRKNAIVTHTGRYQLAKTLTRVGTESAASDVLRHRSPDTIKYYLK